MPNTDAGNALNGQILDDDGNVIDDSANALLNSGTGNIDANSTNEPDLDHGESSRLGRRLSRMETKMEEFIDSMSTRFDQPNQYGSNPDYQHNDRYDTPDAYRDPYGNDSPYGNNYGNSDIVSTVADVDRILDERDRRRTDEDRRYTQDYTNTFDRMKTLDTDNHNDIYTEMMTNFNERRTGNPMVDAEYNYSRAARSVLAKKLASRKPVPNVQNSDALPTGVSASSTSTQANTTQSVHLDPIAKEFADKLGMSDEDIAAAMGGDALTGLQRPHER